MPKVVEKIKNWKGEILYTRDTHFENYLETQEGKHLPVKHCVQGTWGWQLVDAVDAMIPDKENCSIYNKFTFGSNGLQEDIRIYGAITERPGWKFNSITLIGLCTDICVISNALLLKAVQPEVPIIVDASCCAGVTPESHKNALAAHEDVSDRNCKRVNCKCQVIGGTGADITAARIICKGDGYERRNRKETD